MKRRHDKHLHLKNGQCGRCGELALLSSRFTVWKYGRVCRRCFALCTPDVDKLAAFIAGVHDGTIKPRLTIVR